MIFLYLILGHFLADFVFQPDELIEWKNKSWKGVLAHALIHFSFETLLFLPFLTMGNVMPVIVSIVLLHFIIDCSKIFFESKNHHFITLFFLDQAAHLSVIVAGGFLLLPTMSQLPKTGLFFGFYDIPACILYLILAILISYGAEIVKLQFLLEKDPSVKLKMDYWKISARLGIFTVIYILVVQIFYKLF